MKKFIYVMLFCLVFSLMPTKTSALVGGMVWDDTQITDDTLSTSYTKSFLYGGKLYMIWRERDVGAGTYQIWTGSMNLDGTDFQSNMRTTDTNYAYASDIFVYNDKVYVAWIQYDGSGYGNFWSGEEELDGTNWASVQRTTGTTYFEPKIAVSGTKIYYVYWIGGGGIYSAEMNTDGTGFTQTQRASTSSIEPDLLVYGSKVYYVWTTWTNGNTQLDVWWAEMNTDGTGFSSYQLNDTPIKKFDAVFDILSDVVYLGWTSTDATTKTIWTATMNIDRTDFSESKHESYGLGNYRDLEVRAEASAVHYVYTSADDTGIPYLWTATLDTDDFEWRHTQRTTNWSISYDLHIDNNDIYYVYAYNDGGASSSEIWLAKETNIDIRQDATYVEATVPGTLTHTTTSVPSGFACPNAGGASNIATTPNAVDFGNFTGGEDRIGCQIIDITTNATNGYVTTLQINRAPTNTASNTIKPITGTHGSPITWATPPGSGTESYFGYTTDDTDYSQFQTAKYSGFTATQTPYQIATESTPVVNEINYISFQMELTENQEAGIYTANMMYITTAIY